MRKKWLARAVVGILYSILLELAGCSGYGSTSPICTQDLRAGIQVFVKDSVTNAGIASGASLIASEGAFKDSVRYTSSQPDFDAGPISAAAERPGTYQVKVLKANYAPWTQNNIRVTKDVCHVNTVTLTALLQT
jgi:hypothetical protein